MDKILWRQLLRATHEKRIPNHMRWDLFLEILHEATDYTQYPLWLLTYAAYMEWAELSKEEIKEWRTSCHQAS